ncbi:DUF4398 domain-containing protein [Ideonella sp. B7]|uniref:DUF4398 domain-containing protein n=1 Tax=Ideonella benzenivorans TaxID=2831643 RepID=UPI001CED03EB|nr:DUF4398 domain-containing protein [Ideonella benzenivorans]MCA6216707.1 DUF4398 domain-containing protein [Ideonella benzenivorans]
MKTRTPLPLPRAAGLMVISSLLMASCAQIPAPTADMAVSEAALNHAMGAGAMVGAPTEMTMASDKMAQARAAMRSGHHEPALQLAQEARADARLAEAKTEADKAEKAVSVLGEGSRALRDEMNRKTP